MNQKMKDILRPTIKELRDMIFMLRKNALTMAAVIALILILVIALLAPVIVPYPQDIADKTNLSVKFQPPSSAHLFGTDELGRDVFSRVLYGTRISLSTAVLAVALSLVIGVPLGAVAGTSGGAVDEIIMRITDIFLSFPPMLLAILLVSMLGPSLNNAILAIALAWWPWYTRIVRGQAISLKERKFIQAAETVEDSCKAYYSQYNFTRGGAGVHGYGRCYSYHCVAELSRPWCAGAFSGMGFDDKHLA